MRPLQKVDTDQIGGWGGVPAIGGDITTAIPNPAAPTAPTATTIQQNATAATTTVVQQTLLPPPPPPNACIQYNMLSPAFYTWLIQLQRRVGGFSADPLSDTSLVLDSFTDSSQRVSEFESLLVVDPYSTEAARPESQLATFLDALDNPAPLAQSFDNYLLSDTPVFKDHTLLWNDWNLSISGAKVPAANFPTWATLVGNINAYQFAINDYVYLESQEMLHDWAEGTDISLHIHWATGGLNDATVRGVKWEVEYSICNPINGNFGATAFTAATVVSTEDTITAAMPDRTHKITHIAIISGAGLRVGAQIMMRVRRIAAVTNVAPVANPFAISFGIHYLTDVPGSRLITAK